VLDVLRKNAQSTVIKVTFVAIVVVFVFWGVSTVQTDQMQVAATVNDEVISIKDLDRAQDNLVRGAGDLYRETPAQVLRGQALDQLITARLLTQEAERLGLMVSADELREAIAALPVFQVDGRFDHGTYVRVLQANGVRPSDFEASQREQLLMTKLQEVIAAGVHVSDAQARERYRFDNEKVVLRFVKIAAAPFEAAATVSAEDVQGYFDQHREEFRDPERMQIRYLYFEPEKFAAQVTPSEEDIRVYYEAHAEDYQQPEEVRARHILLTLPPEPPAGAATEQKAAAEQQRAAVRARAAEIVSKVKAGEDFAALATSHSEDPGSAKAGGDLGFFARGRMVPAFEDAAFALAPGTVSDVVESPFGLHIIKVEEKRPARTQPLEEVRERIVGMLRQQRGREQALAAAERAHEQLTDGAALETVAGAAGLAVQSPPPFGRTEPVVGLPSAPELAEAVFQTEPNELGEIVTLGSGYVVFRATARSDSFLPDLDAVRARVEAAVKRERGRAAAKERAAALLARLQESKDLDALAAAEGLTVDETGPVSRQGGYVPKLGNLPDLKDRAFRLSPEDPVVPAVFNAQGDAVLAVLKERMPADEAAFEAQKATLLEQERRRFEMAVVQEFVNQLKKGARIEIGQGYASSVGG
jgi:peptidyl-prolyl cis-trans isomerase D